MQYLAKNKKIAESIHKQRLIQALAKQKALRRTQLETFHP